MAIKETCDRENFKSNVCHRLKYLGDIKFVYHTLKANEIKFYWEKEMYFEALYLLAMVDYISRLNNIPICTNYEPLRSAKMQDIIYPSGIYLLYLLHEDENVLKEAYDNAIPEFKRFNIVEKEVRNVV